MGFYTKEKAKNLFLFPSEVGRPSRKDKAMAPGSSHPGDPSVKKNNEHFSGTMV